MDRNGYIEVEGLDKLLRQMERLSPEVQKAAMAGIAKFGSRVIADAQANLLSNSSVATGLLHQAGRAQKSADGKTIDIGFFDTSNRNSGYALYVEYGRRAGKFPPVDELVQWVRKKFGLKEVDARPLGFLVARKIAKKGSTPHPFFQPAVNKNIKELEQDISKALRMSKTFR